MEYTLTVEAINNVLLIHISCLKDDARLYFSQGPIRYTVELDVFSGRSSPSWNVGPSSPLYGVINYGLSVIRPTQLRF